MDRKGYQIRPGQREAAISAAPVSHRILWSNGFAPASVDNQRLRGKEVTGHEVSSVRLQALFVLLTSITDASAVVCARGVYRAGCTGPHGAVVAHRGYRGTYMRATRY